MTQNMTEKQYKKEIQRLNTYYARIEKHYIHTQDSGGMLTALQHEKNERLTILAQRYHATDTLTA